MKDYYLMLPIFPIPDIHSDFDPEAQIVLHTGDALEFTRRLPSGFAKLIITSPPYNIGKDYEVRQSLRHYLDEQATLIGELVRVLHPEGSICWQVGNYVQNGEVFPLDIFYYDIFKDFNLALRNRIIWHFGHGLHASKRFSGRYETLLWFTRQTYTFNLDAVRVPSKYPGKRHYKGKKKGKPSGNPLGKNPSDVWEFVLHEWEQELWDIPNVKSNHPEKTEHPCQYPIELVERCVLAFTNPDEWVFDPYCGVGSSLIGALKHERRAVGCDREPRYTEIATERIEKFYQGQLKIRPMGKPIYQPSGREKVSQIPAEWQEEEKP